LLELFLPQRKPVSRNGSLPQTPPPAVSKLAMWFVAVVFLPVVAHSSPAPARRLYDQVWFTDALSEYQRLLDKQQKAVGSNSSPGQNEDLDGRPPEDRAKVDGRLLHGGDPRLHFNAGAAAYKAGRFEQAEDHFSKALLTDDATLLQQSFYNLGNTHYQTGEAEADPQKRMEQWEKALKDYEGALSLQNNDVNARHNRELVQKKLEELKKQQQQDPNSKDKKDQQKKDPSEQDKKQDQNKSDQDKDQQKQDQAKNSSEDDKKSADSQKKPDSSKDQQKDQQPQNKPGQEKPGEPQKPGQSPGEKPDDKRPPQQAGGTPATATVGNQMTPQQAKQMLDAQKGDDRPLIFLPAEAAKNRNRSIKDW
ncbi:MAG: tetratricopeptide repeat protein, partial [Opitutaceae bacterium]|nr:tetratricopeptide repeat protein [Verrucomicrobiales bacterium]